MGLVLLLAASCFAGWGQPLRADPGQGRGPGLVHAPQRVPVAMPKSVDVRFETPMSITLEAETGATSASYAIDAPPAHGTVTLLGQYANYTPAAGFVGSDSFTFTVTTVDGTSAPATVSL
ncbi:MAG TPA: Ig-like domain-containing protein, partial [Rhodanobacteraceae bacterium]|nr:Ig-like domain-containing protein [Rhodanobacteraceae bacterium]